MVGSKILSDVYYLSIVKGASVNPEKYIPRKKNNMKSLVMSPLRKDPIPNQYINIFSTKKDQSLPP